MFERIKASKIYQGIVRILKSILGFIRKFLRDWGLSFAAMLSYYLLVGLVPMAVAALGIAGLVLDGHPIKQKKFIDQIMSLVPNATVTQSVTKEVNIYLKFSTKIYRIFMFILDSYYSCS